MTDADLATTTVAVQAIEHTARAYWDSVSHGQNADEYQAAMKVVRQAGALRQSLEQWIVRRATRAPRAATTR